MGAKRPTARELQVLAELERGATNKEIAQRLDCSVKTVEFHLNHLFEKFGVHRRAGLVGVALKQASAVPQQGDSTASPREAGSSTENSRH